MRRLVVSVLAGVALGAAVAWEFAVWYRLEQGAAIGVGAMLATCLGAFAYLLARR